MGYEGPKASNIFQNPGIKNNPGVITNPSIKGAGSAPTKLVVNKKEASVADADRYKEQFPKQGTFDARPSTNNMAGVKFEFGKPDVRDGK